LGFSTRLRPTAEASVPGRKRSTGEPGARFDGSLPMIRRKFARVVVRFDSAVRACPAGRELRFGLRHVRARHLADIEAVAGLLERLFEHAHIAALNFEGGGVSKIIHVAGGSLQQDRLLEHTQRLAGSRDLALRRARPVGGLIAVVERLVDGQAGAIGLKGRVAMDRQTLLLLLNVLILIAGAEVDSDLGAIARQRLWHVFVSRAHLGALRVKLRIVLIGAHQRSLDRIRQGRRRRDKRQQQDRNRCSGEELHPMHPKIPFILTPGSCPRAGLPSTSGVVAPPQHRTRSSATELPEGGSQWKLFTCSIPATLLIQNGILTG